MSSYVVFDTSMKKYISGIRKNALCFSKIRCEAIIFPDFRSAWDFILVLHKIFGSDVIYTLEQV